jgi:hypothetical protein
MSGIVFTNYRRSDAAGMAGRLLDRLEQDFSQDQLFFDTDNIPPGKDFVASPGYNKGSKLMGVSPPTPCRSRISRSSC